MTGVSETSHQSHHDPLQLGDRLPRPDRLQKPDQLRILTYNVFGLKFISKFRRERLREIGKRLAALSPAPDIVALQECWVYDDYRTIRGLTQTILPFTKFFFSGIFGGGLVILSRWPIERSSMYRYPLNGRPSAFWRGDWYVGKGVACAGIRIGPAPKDIVEVFCTHMHAPYESGPNDSYVCHRTAQAWEMAKLLRGAVERGHLVIGLGDFNMLPLSPAHRLIETYGSVADTWRLMHPDSSLGPVSHPEEKQRAKGVPSAKLNLTLNGAASDNVLNTWRWTKPQQKKIHGGEKILIDDETPDPKAQRLDYIFIGDDISQRDSKSPGWEVSQAEVCMTGRHPSLGCSLSDHFAVAVTLSHAAPLHTPKSDRHDPWLDPEIYDEILNMTSKYILRETHQQHLRLLHFAISISVSVGCLIAVWWSPRNMVAFLLMLLSTLGFGAGLIDGLIGGLFVESELRALREFEFEISNAKLLATKRVDIK